MEPRLYTAADSLPRPETDFDAIRAAARQTAPRPRFRFRRVAALAAALVLAFTFAAAGYRYDQIQRSMWVLYYEYDWDLAQRAMDDFDLTLPDTLNGYAFYYQTELSVVPRDTPLAQAMLTEFYRPIEIQYAHFLTASEITALLEATPEGGTITNPQEWGPQITIGSTASPYWQHYFSIGEDGLVSHDHVIAGSTQEVAYHDTAIQLYLTQYHHDDGTSSGPYANALWIDEQRACCILVNAKTDDMTTALTMAQQLLDANP